MADSPPLARQSVSDLLPTPFVHRIVSGLNTQPVFRVAPTDPFPHQHQPRRNSGISVQHTRQILSHYAKTPPTLRHQLASSLKLTSQGMYR